MPKKKDAVFLPDASGVPNPRNRKAYRIQFKNMKRSERMSIRKAVRDHWKEKGITSW